MIIHLYSFYTIYTCIGFKEVYGSEATFSTAELMDLLDVLHGLHCEVFFDYWDSVLEVYPE